MIYCKNMTDNQGYQITDEDIEGVLRYLQTNIDKDATRDDAVQFLEEAHLHMHVTAHKLLQDVVEGKIDQDVIRDILKKTREAKRG